MPRLFFSAPDGEADTQISVQTFGQGATRQQTAHVDASDVVPGGVVSFIGWGLVTPSPLVLELLPLGHEPGFYQVSMTTIARVPTTTTGAYNRSLQFSDPLAGPVQILPAAGVNLNVAGVVPNLAPWTVFSSGQTAMTLTFAVAVAPTGSPEIDIYANAILIGA
jgi:hypothetical protein